jgi:hypothetical protein
MFLIILISHLIHSYSCSVRASIRDGHPNFLVTAHSWPIFLYAEYKAYSEDIGRGLLRSKLLVKVCVHRIYSDLFSLFSQAYKHIFTSPASAAAEEYANDIAIRRPMKKSRKDCKSGTSGKTLLSNLDYSLLFSLNDVIYFIYIV